MKQCKRCRRPIGLQEGWEEFPLCECPIATQKLDVVLVSDKAWAALLGMANIPQGYRQSAKGISDWVNTLFITTDPTDTRPDWLINTPEEFKPRAYGLANARREWLCNNRRPRGLLIIDPAKPRIVEWALTVNLFTGQLSYTALAGALLDCVGRGYITPTSLPSQPTSINVKARQRALKQHHQEQEYSIRRVERYLASNHDTPQ